MKKMKTIRDFFWNFSKLRIMPKISLGIVLILLTSLQVNAEVLTSQQKKTVTGRVVSAIDNEPIIGATVSVEGTTTGTITNVDGEFSIEAEASDVILFSFIGFEQQRITVGNQSELKVMLKSDVTDIDEVVVVGYGSIKKSDITGSVSSVDEEEMMKRAPVNIGQGLQGAAAGVMVTRNSGDPAGDVTIRIRGVATVNGSADPLYVVDGIQVGTNANFVNPADIESIEVLKDASSTAIYGARGANGVIMITTKKGGEGQTNLSFTVNTGIQTLQGKLDVADAELFAYSVRQGHENDASSLTNLAFGEDYIGKLNSIDWQDAMTELAFQQSYTLSVSGGNKNSKSLFSVGYMNNDGIILFSNFQRLTARANIEHNVKDFITVGGNLSFSHSERVGLKSGPSQYSPGANIRSYAELTPTMDYVDDDGNFISQPDYHMNDDGTYPTFQQKTGEGDIAKGQDNPYALAMEEDLTPTYENIVMSNAYMDINLCKGLKMKLIGSYRYTAQDSSSFNIENTRSVTADSYNEFTLKQTQQNNLELEGYLTYKWENDKHSVNLMAGASVSKQWEHWVTGSATDFTSDTYRLLSLTNDASSYSTDGGYDLEERYVSYYGRAIYSLMNKYVVTATVRRDGSSNFGEGNRWGIFPSAAFAWHLGEEDFMKNMDAFDFFKIRLGWGQTGNAGEATSLSVAQLSSGHIAYDWGTLGGTFTDYTSSSGVAQICVVDTDLKWEINTQTNIGIDFGIKNTGISGTLDYFIRDSKDLLIYRSIRPSTGYSSIYTNAGHIQNKGLEFSLSYKKNIGNWNLGATLTGSSLKNEVIDVGDDIYNQYSDDGDNWDNHSITTNGAAVGSYYGYEVDGIFKTDAEVAEANAQAAAGSSGNSVWQLTATEAGDYKYVDQNGDDYIDSDDMVVLGDGFPALNYGLNLTAGYKNWDFMMYMYGAAGMEIYSYASMKLMTLYQSGGGIKNTLKDYINNAWTADNTDGKYAAMTITDANENMRASSAYVQKADFLKISSIQLGYTLPKSLLHHAKMESARVYVGVDNVACFSSYNKFGDPEAGTEYVTKTGFDEGRFPTPRTFKFGLSVNF